MEGSDAGAIDYASHIGRRVLIIASSRSVPLDVRVWQQATELVKNGYIVSIISPKGHPLEPAYEKLGNIRIFRHPIYTAQNAGGILLEYTARLVWQFMLAGKIFFSIGFDAIHICNPPDIIFLIGGFFKLFFSKKIFFDYRVPYPEIYQAQFHRKTLSPIMLGCERMMFRVADCVIAANEQCAALAVKRGKIPLARLFTVRSTLAVEPAKMMLPSKKPRPYDVHFTGAFTTSSDTERCIEIIRIITEDHKRGDIQFTVIVDGAGLKTIQRHAALLGIADHITFIANDAHTACHAALAASDIVVYCNQEAPVNDIDHTDIIQAMALAKPVIQSNVLLPHEFAEPILALLSNDPNRAARGESACEYVKSHYQWSTEAPHLLAAYKTLFKDDKAHGSLITRKDS